MSRPKLSVLVVGGDEISRGFARALTVAGHEVRTLEPPRHSGQVRPFERLPFADLLILAMPGSALTDLITEFTARDLWLPGQLVAHTAGEFGYSVLAPAVACGVIPMAIHPSMRFTDSEADSQAIREAYFAVAAPDVALPIAQALVIDMGAEPIVIAEADRKTYFEAWSVAHDFSILVVNQAIGLLKEIGVVDPRGLLGPVVRASVEQALDDGHRDFDDLDDLEALG